MNCQHCHTCGEELLTVLDGEEWCEGCGAYRRYRSHGWTRGEHSPCPGPAGQAPPADTYKPSAAAAKAIAALFGDG